MKEYYDILDALKNHLQANPNVNTIHEGDIYKLDLPKESIYPITNIDTTSVDFLEHTVRFNVRFIFADILDETKENEKDEKNVFHGANNLQDIYNTQLSVCNVLQTFLRRGDLMDNGYVLNREETTTAMPFEQRFEKLLVGWKLDVAITVPNDDVSIC